MRDGEGKQEQVGRCLRRFREEHALGLGEAARLAGVDTGNLCRIERGQLRLSEVTAWRLARLYGAGVLKLVEAGTLLPAVGIVGKRERAFDDLEGDLSAFILPGGVRVLVPTALARAFA